MRPRPRSACPNSAGSGRCRCRRWSACGSPRRSSTARRRSSRHAAQELTARRAQAAADLKHEAEIGSDADAALARLDEEEAKLAEDGAAAAERIAAARALAEEAAAAVTASEAEFSAAAGALAAAAAERAARERAMREAQAKLRRLEEERDGVLKQRDRLQARAWRRRRR